MKYYIAFVLLGCLAVQVFAKDVNVTILQANDVYEISPIGDGRYGGLARVQTVLKQLKRTNPNTISVLAGDLFNPSAIGTAKVEGERLNGKQMVDVLNHMDWDYITLGNHEFDKGYDVLVKRLSEAQFKTVSSNILNAKTNALFENTQEYDIVDFDGMRLGIAGITLQALSKDFVKVLHPLTEAERIVSELKVKHKCDVIVLITHQSINDDLLFAEALNDVDLIIGGHEHENIYLRRGLGFTPIAKADANARSVYVHNIHFDTDTKSLDIESRLQLITNDIEEDKHIKSRTSYWEKLAYSAFNNIGIKPKRAIANVTEPLDGLDSTVRSTHTRLTELIAESALSAFSDADISFINGGSIRVDDIISPGVITEYDLMRILPFGGDYILVEMPGDIVIRTLKASEANKGEGGFLHYANIVEENGLYSINGKLIYKDHIYRCALPEFLIKHGDKGLEFLTVDPRIKSVDAPPVNVLIALKNQLIKEYSVVSE